MLEGTPYVDIHESQNYMDEDPLAALTKGPEERPSVKPRGTTKANAMDEVRKSLHESVSKMDRNT